jgi:predicted TIM-barrel fold metal-dependent hydrolase
MRIIDAWMQHPSARFLADPMFDSLRRWGHEQLAAVEIPVEATIGAMDAAHVEVGMLCAWWGPHGPLITNDEVAAMVGRYPNRFAGVAAVDLARPMDAVRELRRCVRDLGFRALRVVPWLWNLPPDDRRYYPLHAECVELGCPVQLKVASAPSPELGFAGWVRTSGRTIVQTHSAFSGGRGVFPGGPQRYHDPLVTCCETSSHD